MSVIYEALQKMKDSNGTPDGIIDGKKKPGKPRNGLFTRRLPLLFVGILAGGAVFFWLRHQNTEQPADVAQQHKAPETNQPQSAAVPGVKEGGAGIDPNLQTTMHAGMAKDPNEKNLTEPNTAGKTEPVATVGGEQIAQPTPTEAPPITPTPSVPTAANQRPEPQSAPEVAIEAAGREKPALPEITRKKTELDTEYSQRTSERDRVKGNGQLSGEKIPKTAGGVHSAKEEMTTSTKETPASAVVSSSPRPAKPSAEEKALAAAYARSSRVMDLTSQIQQETNRGNDAKVEQLITDLRKIKKADDPFLLKIEAFQHLNQNRLPEARSLLKRVLEADHYDTDAAMNMAVLEYNEGETEKAKARLRELAEIHPGDDRVTQLIEQLR